MHLQCNTLVSVCGYKQGSFITVCKMEHQMCFLASDEALFHLDHQIKEVKTCRKNHLDTELCFTDV